MFCPRCSQEQKSEEIRYCSFCGFPLVMVEQLLANGGRLSLREVIYNKLNGSFTRSNGWKFGLAWFLVFSFLLTPILAIMGAAAIIPFTRLLGFVGGLLIILLSLIFLKNEPQTRYGEQFGSAQKAKENDVLHVRSNSNVLPPQQSVEASTYVPPMNSWKAAVTSDLAHPISVIESTTNLLEKDE